ncbi:SDR family oxidoreductase [Psychromicrobium xiongbiense]|uniref:SDR family oxidoreductase n=1 Tax=Psychromicrobium xiongbiense TaxID=3051184 RepID=UPI002554B763|nr:SDR family oxidoreductase [Psychromicrobium sp. YIM S02556]
MSDSTETTQTVSFDLSGKLALVTGSSRGIGRAIARGLAEAGATVVIHGRQLATVEATAREFAATFGEDRVVTATFDVTDPEQVREGVAALIESAGVPDVLVNNAGLQHRVPLLELDYADWERVIRTDLSSLFLIGQAVAGPMVTRGSGKIINIGSVQSELARPTIAPYTAAKGGVRNLTKAMAAEWARFGLQVNSLAPGYIHTEMTQNLVDDDAFNSWVIGRTPAARWGTVEDLVGPAVWLASDASNFVNGQTIFIDGGMTAVV